VEREGELVARKTYDYAQCNGCFQESRMRERRHALGSGPDELPEGWIEVYSADGKRLWDLCDGCHKEVTAMLFDSARINRVAGLDQRKEPA
jgi:hypothetical protein